MGCPFKRFDDWPLRYAMALVVVLNICLVGVGCNEVKTIMLGGDTSEVIGMPQQADITIVPGGCPPSALLGCVTPYSFKYCNEAGNAFIEESCPTGQLCFGAGECRAATCVPGTKACSGLATQSVCSADGSGFEVLGDCGIGLVCQVETGECVSSCILDTGKAKSNVGCTYSLVDLGNFESEAAQSINDDKPVIVVVSNTSEVEANIEITSSDTGLPLDIGAAQKRVPGRDLKTFALPNGRSQLVTSINRDSWVLTSDQPITVHLINPENGLDVKSNDATLLFPTDALGNDYRIMGWKSFWTLAQGRDESGYPNYGFESYLTVVATSSSSTTVTVTPTASIQAGTNADGSPIDVISAGEQRIFSLQNGDVLNLTTLPTVGLADLTGTRIQASQPVAAFFAHNCAFIPAVDVPFCDHLEHQLAPVNTWGKEYVADVFKSRGEGGYDMWRVMAANDGTVLNSEPAIPELSGRVLNAGEWVEYKASQSHIVSANGPIQMGHFMIGSNFPGFDEACGDTVKTGIGDPAFTIGVATTQYIDSYVVLTPPGYSDDWLNIVKPVGVAVTLDGSAVGSGVAVGSTGFELVQVPVADGVHIIDGDEPFGVTAYGYDCDVSYAYPGGMLLAEN